MKIAIDDDIIDDVFHDCIKEIETTVSEVITSPEHWYYGSFRLKEISVLFEMYNILDSIHMIKEEILSDFQCGEYDIIPICECAYGRIEKVLNSIDYSREMSDYKCFSEKDDFYNWYQNDSFNTENNCPYINGSLRDKRLRVLRRNGYTLNKMGELKMKNAHELDDKDETAKIYSQINSLANNLSVNRIRSDIRRVLLSIMESIKGIIQDVLFARGEFKTIEIYNTELFEDYKFITKCKENEDKRYDYEEVLRQNGFKIYNRDYILTLYNKEKKLIAKEVNKEIKKALQTYAFDKNKTVLELTQEERTNIIELLILNSKKKITDNKLFYDLIKKHWDENGNFDEESIALSLYQTEKGGLNVDYFITFVLLKDIMDKESGKCNGNNEKTLNKLSKDNTTEAMDVVGDVKKSGFVASTCEVGIKAFILVKGKEEIVINAIKEQLRLHGNIGKKAALIIESAEDAGLVDRTITFPMVQEGFDVEGSDTAYNNYINKNRFTESEKKPYVDYFKSI